MAKCKNCIHLDRQGWCEEMVDSPEPNRERECYYFEQMTNADRIRAMGDEELAECFASFVKTSLPDKYCKDFYQCKSSDDCKECMLEWLKKEVEDG